MNLITAEVRARAVAEAQWTDRLDLATHANVADRRRAHRALGRDSIGVMQAALFTGASPRGTAELVMMLTHHPELTHFDSLVRQVVNGKVYPKSRSRSPAGAAGNRHGSTAVFAQGVVTLGVLVDLAADGPLPEDHGVFGELTDLALQFAPNWPAIALKVA